jgi:hypothetical protein
VTSGVLTCTFSNVAATGTATIQLVRNTSTADCGQTFTNTASVTGGANNIDPNTANNSSTASIAVSCTNVVPPTTGVVQICGQVTLYVPATTTGTGSVRINGMTFTIAANTATPALANTFSCLTFTFTNGLVTGIVVAPNLANVLLVCGVFTPVSTTATAQTTLFVGNMLFTLQPGLTIPSWLLAFQGQTLCFFLNSSGQINGVLTNIPTSIRPVHAQAYRSVVARED